MTYKELCKKMMEKGWGSHPVLCLNGIKDPGFTRGSSDFCTVGNLKQLDTHTLYEQQEQAPDSSEWVGEPIKFSFLDPKSGGTARKTFDGWIYREKGLVGFFNEEKQKHLLCALSDVEGRLGAVD